MNQMILSRRILVVDDYFIVCEAVKRVLGLDGLQVETATSAKDALAVLAKNRFDLIILDYEMPDVNGDQLASGIRSLAPEQPIIMLTACLEKLASSGHPIVGVDLVLGKPFQSEELRQWVAKLLQKQSSGQNPPYR